MAHLLGNTIRSRREKKGCSLHSLARQVGCSHVYLWKLERGETFTDDRSTLQKIANALELNGFQQEELFDAANKSLRTVKLSAALPPIAYEIVSLVRTIVEASTEAQLQTFKSKVLAADEHKREVQM
jgi:transcriptional regulator with XRE-family HTH domain